MPDEPMKLGLWKRIDVLAVTNPTSNRRNVWFMGVMAVWGATSLVFAVAGHRWGTAAILLAMSILTGGWWWVLLRARRRIPATQAWLDDVVD